MIVDHERVQELLAGLALHALDQEELRDAKELMASHVSECEECRGARDAFESVAGGLALAAGPRRPPKTLGVRLRREVDPSARGRRWVTLAPAATAVVVVAGMALWNAHLTTRIGDAEQRQATSAEVLSAVSHPASKVLPLPLQSIHSAPTEAPAQLAAAVIPGRPVLYVFGSMPSPGSGRVYTVWLGRSGRYVNVAVFVPERGSVLLALRVDPAGYERLLITEESGKGRGSPSENHLTEVSL